MCAAHVRLSGAAAISRTKTTSSEVSGACWRGPWAGFTSRHDHRPGEGFSSAGLNAISPTSPARKGRQAVLTPAAKSSPASNSRAWISRGDADERIKNDGLREKDQPVG